MTMSNIFLITAPSGAGKTTIAQAITKHGEWIECISHTTREKREGEKHGLTYFFVDNDTFDTMLANGELAEHVTYNGNSYGISKAEIEFKLSKGQDVFIIVEYEGYLQVKNQYPEAIGIFLYMSKEDCVANMLLRGDTLDQALSRAELYDEEMDNSVWYDYVIKNVRDKQFETQNIIKSIIKQYRKNTIYVDTTPPYIGGVVSTGTISSVK